MKQLFFCLVIVFITNLLLCQTRVLFIGNSYTYYNNLPLLTSDCAKSIGLNGITLEMASSTPGGTSFRKHTKNAITQQLIAEGNWDFVILQEQSQIPSLRDFEVQQNCFPYASLLKKQIDASDSCTKIIFYMTWGRKNGDAENCNQWPKVCTYEGMDSLLNLRYRQMAINNHASLSPVGAVWHYLIDNNPEINLYAEDGSHPSFEGSYAAACSMISVMFGISPKLITYNGTLDASTGEKIRIAADKVVFDHLQEWQTHE